MPMAQVGDINMYYRVYGEGESLVLIMGHGMDARSWVFQTPEFSREYQVIGFDNRGVGRTDAPDSPYSIAMMADDTAGLMDILGIEKAHILGVSMGGMIAQEFALKYPHRVKSLILATTAARFPSEEVGALASIFITEEGVSQETRIRKLLPNIYTDKFFENPEQVQRVVDAMLANPNPQPAYAAARQGDAAAQHDTRDRLGQITAPTLVLVGKEDIVLPVKLSEELAEGIPNAELVVLEGGGHGFNFEIPDKFNQAVLDFLARVREKG